MQQKQKITFIDGKNNSKNKFFIISRPVPGSVPEPGSNVLAPKGRYSSTELVYTQAGNIKPVLPGQGECQHVADVSCPQGGLELLTYELYASVTFTKSTVTSNGLTAGVKLQNNGSVKDYSIGTLVKSGQINVYYRTVCLLSHCFYLFLFTAMLGFPSSLCALAQFYISRQIYRRNFSFFSTKSYP